MQLTPQNVRLLGDGLDHPECVCIGEDRSVYAGGEAGQIYSLTPEGKQRTLVQTGGFFLGIALDGHGSFHACDIANPSVVCIGSDGTVRQRSTGTADRKMTVPNYAAFDSAGNLFVSDSGDYWPPEGTGCIFVVRPSGETEVFHRGPFRFANGLAISPDGKWLYVVQSTAANIVRVPLERPNGPIEVTHELPTPCVPDGIAFTRDGSIVVACYKPDAVLIATPDGKTEVLYEDPTGELLNRPTNVALVDGMLYVANVGGWHITAIETDLNPAPIYRPVLDS